MKPKTNKGSILIIIPIIVALIALGVAGFGQVQKTSPVKVVATYGTSKDQLGAVVVPDFPTSLSDHQEDDVIEEEHINILEEVLGITNDTNSTSHDYMIRDRMTFAYGTTTFLTLSGGTLTDTLTGKSLSLTYGISSATGTFTGVLTATGGMISATSTITGDLRVEGNSTTTNLSITDIAVGSARCLQIDAAGNLQVSSAACAIPDGASNWLFTGESAISPTSTDASIGLIVSASSTFTASTTFEIVPTFPSGVIGFGIFGDKSDGASTTDATTTLAADMYFTDLTVNADQTLYTNGYRIFVTGTLTNNGTISHVGANATSGESQALGGSFATLGGGTSGGRGETETTNTSGGGGGGGGVIMIAAHSIINTGTITAAGGNGSDALVLDAPDGKTSGLSTSTSLGGSGGIGGTGNVAGQAGGVATGVATSTYGNFRHIPAAIDLRIDNPIATDYHDNLIKGGTGGGGGDANGATGHGGGGGGGGGVIVLIYVDKTDTGTITVAGGAGGSATGTGTAGTAGVAGTLIEITK